MVERNGGAAGPSAPPHPLADGMAGVRTIEWREGVVVLIDQRRLPLEESYLTCHTWEEVAQAISTMAIRGAPALGVAAAMGMALAARTALEKHGEDSCGFRQALQAASKGLYATRPTAHNLPWALREMESIWRREDLTPAQVTVEMEQVAVKVYEDDLACCWAIGEKGATLITGEEPVVLTHCNAGALATAGYGTALGVIRSAFARNRRLRVVADETRPLLQGARLTAWELMKDGIPVELITDNMAGYLMGEGLITHVVVGADRIAANGDVANKIGTYTVSVLAHQHGIPFFVAAPCSTLDLTLAEGSLIPIEERSPSEVTGFDSLQWAPPGVSVRNPAFDITPNSNVTAIITEKGIAYPPYEVSLRRFEAVHPLLAGSIQQSQSGFSRAG